MLSQILPLTLGTAGFSSFTDEEIKEAVSQNFKMLLLTIKGEYVMDLNFGVGITTYLFQLSTSANTRIIESEIKKQIRRYMPYVRVQSVDFNLQYIDSNSLGVRIEYSINRSVINEVFELTVTP